MTIYEITEEYRALLDLGADPEDEQLFLDTLEGLDFELELKADDYAAVIAEFTAHADKVQKEIDRLTGMKKAAENSVKRMKERLLKAMQETGKDKIKTDLHTFSIQKNGGKQALDIFGDVPDEYLKVVYEKDADKIREDLQAGKELPFARLLERGVHLRIR